jgi:type II secretory pathway pseudopilin PulG
MMVVISVIGILVALLLPVLSYEKAQAKRATCLNNLRQLDVGLRMYCDDSNDISPTNENAQFGTQAWSSYRELMKTYVGVNGQSSGQDKMFACPPDEFYIGMTKTGAFLYNPYLVRSNLWKQSLFDYSSYGFNGGTAMRSFGYNASPGIGGLKLSSVNNPAKTVLLAEAPAFYPYSWHH